MGFDNYEFDPATDNNSEEHADFAAIGDSVNEDKIKQSVLKRLFHHYPSTMNHSTLGDHTMVCYDTASSLITASSLLLSSLKMSICEQKTFRIRCHHHHRSWRSMNSTRMSKTISYRISRQLSQKKNQSNLKMWRKQTK